METPTPKTIVVKAVNRGELDKLLLGAPEYQYRSKYSPAPGDTDLTELLAVLYDHWDPADRKNVESQVAKAVYAIIGTYEGIEPVAACVLLESLRKARGKASLGLPLEDIASRLRRSIDAFSEQLRADKTGGGANWPDGRLGDLRRLSRNTEYLGGPSFCK